MSDIAAATPTSPVTGEGRAVRPGGAGLLLLLEPLMVQAAGSDTRAVSLQIDLAVEPGEVDLSLSAQVERVTRTLVFATAEARRPDGRLAATVSGVFRRI